MSLSAKEVPVTLITTLPTFPRQQWLRELSTRLRCTYISYLVVMYLMTLRVLGIYSVNVRRTETNMGRWFNATFLRYS